MTRLVVFSQKLKFVDNLNSAVVKEFTYDGVSNILALKDENGHVTSYFYDNAYRKTKVIDPEGLIMTNAYSPKNELIEKVLDPNGLNITTQFDFDAASG